MRATRLVVPAAVLLVVGFAAPANAVVTVFGNFVQGDATNENISVSCVAGVLSANGVTGDPCAPMTSMSVNPQGGTDTVDLTQVTAAAFPALVSTSVQVEDGEADIVNGSPLSDVITGDTSDALNGNAGNDQLTGGGSVSGGLGDDTIIEFVGSSLASGGPGDDRFVQFIPQGGLEGGTGFDSWDVDFDQASPNVGANLDVTLTADQVNIVLGPQVVAVPIGGLEQAYWTLLRGDAQSFNGSAFPGILNIRGMAGVDTLTGGPSDDALYGGGDNDTVTGNGGADILQGGDGNDTIQARDGLADRVDCGAGTDVAVADAIDVVVGCETVDVPPAPPVVTPPPPPAVVPVTGAVSGPKKVTVPKKATFTFSSTTPGATFQCKVDDKAFKACASPFKIATKKLKVGKHTLLVRAVVGGVVDATPSKKTFKVKKG